MDFERFSLLIQFNKWTPELQGSLPKIFEEINNILEEKGIRITAWKIVEDEFKLFVSILARKDYAHEEIISNITDIIGAKTEKLNVSVISQFGSPIETVYYDPKTDYALLKANKKTFPLIISVLKNYVSNKENKKIFCSNIKKVLSELSGSKFTNISQLCKVIEKQKTRIEKLIERLGDLLNLDVKALNVLLSSLLIVEKNKIDYETLLEKLFLISDIHMDNIKNIVAKLGEEGFIRHIDGVVTITEYGENVLQLAKEIGGTLEKWLRSPIKKRVKELFNEIDKTVGHVVYRDGALSDFSFARIFFSLSKIGVKPETSLNLIDGILSSISNKNVPLEELVNAVKTSLLEWDPSGESASKYILFLESRKNILIDTGAEKLPFGRDVIRSYVKRFLRDVKLDHYVPDNLVRELADDIYDNIRNLVSYPSQTIVIGDLREKIIIEEEFVEKAIEAALSSYFPLLKTLATHNPIEMEEKLLTKARGLVEEISKKSMYWEIKNSVLSLIETIVMCISLLSGILPTWSITKNIALLQTKLKSNGINVLNPVILKEKKRILGFLRDARRFSIKVLKDNFNQKDLQALNRFIRFSEKILYLIEKAISGATLN